MQESSNDIFIEKLCLFPSLVFVIDNFLTFDQCETIKHFLLKNVKFTDHAAIIGNNSKSSFLDNMFVIETLEQNNVVKRLKDKINAVLDQYKNNLNLIPELNNSSVCLTNSWVNIQNKSSVLFDHIHNGAIAAGVLYLEVDGKSSPLELHSPNNVQTFLSKAQHSKFYIDPKIGKLVIFPGWITHGFSSLNQSERRIALSFNCGIGNM